MSEPGTRPGGLTALAVINFIFAGLGLIGALGMLAGPALVRHAASAHAVESKPSAYESSETRSAEIDANSEKARRQHEELQEAARKLDAVPFYLFVVAAAVEVVLAALLLISGIGYLKLRRFLGKTLGTAYGVIAILWGLAEVLYMNKMMTEQSMGLLNMIGFIYPVITLLCLRVVFKDDFVNP